MRSPEDQTEAPCPTLITFAVGPYRLCAPAAPVRSILAPSTLARLPLSGPAAAGVFRHHGHVALAFDLHYQFGLPSRRDTHEGVLIVTDIKPGRVAFWVDAVSDVLSATAFSWRAMPPSLTGGIVERFACAQDALFLYATYERLFRESRSLARATGLSARAPAVVPVLASNSRTKLEVSSERKTPNENSGRVEPKDSDWPLFVPKSLATAPPSGRKAGHDWPRVAPPVRRPAIAKISQSASRSITSRITDFAGPAEGMLAREQSSDTAHPVAPKRIESFSPSFAGVLLLLPLLLAGIVYWSWSGDRNSAPESATSLRPAPVRTGPAASPLPAPAAVTERSKPAQPAVSGSKFQVTTSEFTVTVESPGNGTDRAVGAPVHDDQDGHGEQVIHRVRRGDTLWAISGRYLGDPFLYPELARRSTISDPDLIYPGDIVRIRRTGDRTSSPGS